MDRRGADDFDLVLVPVSAITRHTLYRRYSEWVRDHLAKNPVDVVVGINKIPDLDVYYAGDLLRRNCTKSTK